MLDAGFPTAVVGTDSSQPRKVYLFTTAQPLIQMWRGVDSYNGHDIVFTPTRSTGTAILDPDNGPTNPSNFYRSIVGNLNVMTHQVTGAHLPPGVRGSGGVVHPGR